MEEKMSQLLGTGAQDAELEAFLSKVSDAERQIKGLKDGTLKPEDVHVLFSGKCVIALTFHID
jgi:hypothetical protein